MVVEQPSISFVICNELYFEKLWVSQKPCFLPLLVNCKGEVPWKYCTKMTWHVAMWNENIVPCARGCNIEITCNHYVLNRFHLKSAVALSFQNALSASISQIKKCEKFSDEELCASQHNEQEHALLSDFVNSVFNERIHAKRGKCEPLKEFQKLGLHQRWQREICTRRNKIRQKHTNINSHHSSMISWDTTLLLHIQDNHRNNVMIHQTNPARHENKIRNQHWTDIGNDQTQVDHIVISSVYQQGDHKSLFVSNYHRSTQDKKFLGHKRYKVAWMGKIWLNANYDATGKTQFRALCHHSTKVSLCWAFILCFMSTRMKLDKSFCDFFGCAKLRQ